VLTPQNLEDSRSERFIHNARGAQNVRAALAPGDPGL
jgi:hypothetical protein